ncbi:MAG: hypothetical protein A3H69_00335 [Candidatus Sungbacteria bacterium RIFCSPLOWO2_02_FULL_47_9]|uniref:Thiamine pyrophosphate enzyme TPP-binding domain-containing protein n=1 Tax=Candidatus Sungbacteria bacterium RIFCSPHIGHO2_01_FULL_47_32 TaxID=1802264 RepID=A0A1G2K6W9_9BACT|nr:MAG: Pyruvate synthase [Parcubacteria group bacterium GW2011_GWA2_47_10]OGZ94178.1 MAG: hypothetical protein A2633_02930 [Candidatus Sungbacteria bacterium RIFCSPHIGHO2_01_FULL_47_32]OHA00010.1 MAG: hypothetical protein A3D57_03735 [Candidatus Sungbacteria bacterium RIFCSPHIGHO2_02_FULL_46_12]OHA06258.1 MAG: hypothetical protein A3A28_02075 [Candidatus Sungbacteria bacterium RIFCSPLOWO2_01_FULL_47_32]OHA09781.1 MAG: hypothetical protein A3H69_00335 [Candidatus Sungbacteria bacterium RIFCSPLO
MKPKDVTVGQFLDSRHALCPGCGSAAAMAHVLSIVSKPLPSGRTKKIRAVVFPASCWSIGSGASGESFLGVNLVNVPFIAASAVAEGISIMSEREGRGEEELTIAWAGDGSSFDIGMGLLSGAASRNADILYVINDNQIYGNTGAQESGATPEGARTTTSVEGKEGIQKDIVSIMMAHSIPYFASAVLSPTTLTDFYEKVATAADMRGFRCLHLLSVCPPGWKCPTDSAPELGELAVSTRIFPLVEIKNGTLRLTHPKRVKPVEEFLKYQGRFSYLMSDEARLNSVKEKIERKWKYLSKLEEL